jgi:hypothetical protein
MKLCSTLGNHALGTAFSGWLIFLYLYCVLERVEITPKHIKSGMKNPLVVPIRIHLLEKLKRTIIYNINYLIVIKLPNARKLQFSGQLGPKSLVHEPSGPKFHGSS